MPATENGPTSSSSARLINSSDHFSSTRSFADLPEVQSIRLSFDIVSAARRNIGFLRNVDESLWIHEPAYLAEAVRRYDELWMPLVSELMINGSSSNVGSTAPMVLPPFDVEWVWFCHSLNLRSYRQYCEQRFSRLIGKPSIFDEVNEEYALNRCKQLWLQKYPNQPFENEAFESTLPTNCAQEELIKEVKKNRNIYKRFCWPHMSEIVYLIAAKQRYKGFLFLLRSYIEGGSSSSSSCSKLVPSLDILLMWITHQSYPTVYAQDLKEMEASDMVEMVVGLWDTAKEKHVQETKNLWDKVFDQPYEKAGGAVEFSRLSTEIIKQPPVYWQVSDSDVNTKYKSLLPRFLLETCVFVRLSSGNSDHIRTMKDEVITKNKFLRVRMVRCHKELKIDNPGASFLYESWRKLGPSLYCEFGTRGVVVELRRKGGGICFKSTKVDDSATFLWSDLLRAPSLSLERKIGDGFRVVASMTPPAQAPYLLKCVPDRVTDDSGAMISDVILRMNNYKPQEGRWLSRTVLDHAGRECFVVRMRVGGGFWRRGGETPSTVKRDDRIVEVREGSWSYVAGSIGRAPEKVVGTATPKEPPEDWEVAWLFSTGEELLVSSRSSSSSNSIHDLRFRFSNQSSSSSVRLLTGRKMEYNASNNEEQEEAESGFVTLVRYTEDDPIGKATALLNWKLLIMELQPEEDAVLVLLICIAIVRSVSEMRKEDVGKLLIRRRVKEAKLGDRDWGSVIMDHSDLVSCSSSSSAYLQPWYLNDNVKITVCSDRGENGLSSHHQQPVASYSLVEDVPVSAMAV